MNKYRRYQVSHAHDRIYILTNKVIKRLEERNGAKELAASLYTEKKCLGLKNGVIEEVNPYLCAGSTSAEQKMLFACAQDAEQGKQPVFSCPKAGADGRFGCPEHVTYSDCSQSTTFDCQSKNGCVTQETQQRYFDCQSFSCSREVNCSGTIDFKCSGDIFKCSGVPGFKCTGDHLFGCNYKNECSDSFDCSGGTSKSCDGEPVSCATTAEVISYGCSNDPIRGYAACVAAGQHSPDNVYPPQDVNPGDFRCGGRSGRNRPATGTFECDKVFTCQSISDFSCTGQGQSNSFKCNTQEGDGSFTCGNQGSPPIGEFECYGIFSCPNSVDCKSEPGTQTYTCPSRATYEQQPEP